MTSNRYPPGPKGIRLFGRLLRASRNPAEFLRDLALEYGDISHFKIGPQDFFLINHPNCIKDILATNHQNFSNWVSWFMRRSELLQGEGILISEGEGHTHRRRLAGPPFHHDRIVRYGDIMTEFAVRMNERWRRGKVLDIEQEMTRLTLGIAVKMLFSLDIESDGEELANAMGRMIKLFNKTHPALLPMASFLRKVPLLTISRLYSEKEWIEGEIQRLIEERKRKPIDTVDILSTFLQSFDDQGRQMSQKQIRDEVMSVLLAGHDPAAKALTWTWYLLSRHPEVEAKLHTELDTVLADRLPTVKDLEMLQYTKMVFTEAMRVFPPVWIIIRKSLSDCEIGNFNIPAKSMVLVSQYVTHRDPRLYPDPLRFDPERWTPEAKALRPEFAYFPFGGGPRLCVGESFAWLEGMLTIATLAKRWKMRPVPGHPVETLPLITLRPKYGMKMILEQRK